MDIVSKRRIYHKKGKVKDDLRNFESRDGQVCPQSVEVKDD